MVVPMTLENRPGRVPHRSVSPSSLAWWPFAVFAMLAASATFAGEPEAWPSYGNDVGGSRYSPLSDITPANVDSLE